MIEQLGGSPTPGVGFGSGIERIIMNLREAGLAPPEGLTPRPDLYIVYLGESAHSHALRLAADLRHLGLSISLPTGSRSLRAQLRSAGAANARYALIVGEDEIEKGSAALRELDTGEQSDVSLVSDAIRTALAD